MPNPRELDPGASPIAFFGYELRRYRQEAELTQSSLARRAGYALGTISMAETGRRAPTADFARRCDEVLGAGGALIRIKEMIDNVSSRLPAWFRPWVEIEQAAENLYTWQPLIMPGLLQTADYARVLFSNEPRAVAEEVEQNVAARMDRQHILEREDPPLLWVVLDEGVLGRLVGDKSIMADQLGHLLSMAQRPHVTVQILPLNSGNTTGFLGGFFIAHARGVTNSVYMESAGQGQVSDRPDDVADITTKYEAIRAEALPQRASLKMIEEMRERWTKS
ncbi:transcriptional regulator with XRE-family HTH domain [Streptosporangium becharense]|uniref:Transcriptional regulator with XRE-family HTH domain n=1 Tax=Streptosporangium becharense TaxID=1816182 RepID=A0A7W9IM84_9ACTN|nr:helix-turn-helix transcriptional regulator [Streptosporangium becharense]MBB2910581.1 transcriptional regulator with XRE-family HTH domain [Streptosporangium becharense]MBB5823324.1 transcriptional regulator with XRE-family HTH domain [Streptosporangium becharense]